MKWNFSQQINPNFCERQFFIEVMNKLSLHPELDDSFNFIITNYDDNTLSLYERDKQNIVIYLSDEYGIFFSTDTFGITLIVQLFSFVISTQNSMMSLLKTF